MNNDMINNLEAFNENLKFLQEYLGESDLKLDFSDKPNSEKAKDFIETIDVRDVFPLAFEENSALIDIGLMNTEESEMEDEFQEELDIDLVQEIESGVTGLDFLKDLDMELQLESESSGFSGLSELDSFEESEFFYEEEDDEIEEEPMTMADLYSGSSYGLERMVNDFSMNRCDVCLVDRVDDKTFILEHKCDKYYVTYFSDDDILVKTVGEEDDEKKMNFKEYLSFMCKADY